jgi:hypothetical protein
MLLVLHWQQGPDGRAPQRQPSSSATTPVVPHPVDGQTTDNIRSKGRGGRVASGVGVGARGGSNGWGWQLGGRGGWCRSQERRRRSAGHEEEPAAGSTKRRRNRRREEEEMWMRMTYGVQPELYIARNLIWLGCWN